MATKKGIHISGHYVVSINATVYAFFMYVLCILKIERSDIIVKYTEYIFNAQTNIRHCVLISGHVKFILTVVSSN